MKAFACGDVIPGCDARWVCASEEEILQQLVRHVRSAHGMPEPPSELADSARAAISTVSA